MATRPSPEDFLRILRQIQGITKVIIHLVFSLIRFNFGFRFAGGKGIRQAGSNGRPRVSRTPFAIRK